MKKKNDETIISVSGVNKTFKLPHERRDTIKSIFLNIFKKKMSYEEQHVLKDVSFDIKKGEFFGIVGRNGSGKSTLLKILAEIYQVSSGKVDVRGSLTSFIELGIGFNPELTGRENVYLNGAILGLTRKEISREYEKIVEFAELDRFMDQKLKNYSSGMQVRLAFAIAIQAHNEILLIDEVLAVGDAKFQRKCYNVFKNIKKTGKTVILVTHDMGAVQEYCDRAMIINKGEIVSIGDVRKVAAEYNKINFSDDPGEVSGASNKNDEKFGSQDVVISGHDVFVNTKKTLFAAPNEEVKISFHISVKREKINDEGILFGYSLLDADNRVVFGSNSKDHNCQIDQLKSGERYTITAQFMNLLANGSYRLCAAIKSADGHVLYDQKDDIAVIEVAGWQLARSTLHISNEMEIKKND